MKWDNSLHHEELSRQNGLMPRDHLEWSLAQSCLWEIFDMPNTVIFTILLFDCSDCFILPLCSLNFSSLLYELLYSLGQEAGLGNFSFPSP